MIENIALLTTLSDAATAIPISLLETEKAAIMAEAIKQVASQAGMTASEFLAELSLTRYATTPNLSEASRLANFVLRKVPENTISSAITAAEKAAAEALAAEAAAEVAAAETTEAAAATTGSASAGGAVTAFFQAIGNWLGLTGTAAVVGGVIVTTVVLSGVAYIGSGYVGEWSADDPSAVPGVFGNVSSRCVCQCTDGRHSTCQNNGCVEPENFSGMCYWKCGAEDGRTVYLRGIDMDAFNSYEELIEDKDSFAVWRRSQAN